MLRQNTHSPSRRLRFAAIIAGFALVALLCQFAVYTAQGCNLLNGNGWVLITILRPIFLAACHSIHLAENPIDSSFLSQIASSAEPLLCVFAALVPWHLPS